VADVGQFQTLLAEAVTGDPARGLIPGTRPDPDQVSAARDGLCDPDAVAVGRFQLFRPEALGSDGSLPAGFRGAGHWLWPTQPLADVPRVEGERVVLLGEPAFRATWAAARKLSWLVGELDVVEVMSSAAVSAWLGTSAGEGTARRAA
jgi:hypothetical protein